MRPKSWADYDAVIRSPYIKEDDEVSQKSDGELQKLSEDVSQKCSNEDSQKPADSGKHAHIHT